VRRAPRRLALLGGLVVAALALLASPASAHPLGNFTVNTADQVVVDRTGVDVVHRVDLAEVPTVQLNSAWDRDHDKRLSPVELRAYATDACDVAVPLLALDVDGRPTPLRVLDAQAQARPGQGLPTTLLTCRLRGDGGARSAVALSDASSDGRTGWREITATARCGRLSASDVPTTSPSALLTRYPADLLRSPLDVRSTRLSVVPGPCTRAAPEAQRAERTALPRGLGGVASRVTDFLGRPSLTVPFALLSALAALAFGAFHALAPGHGKTVLAAYLVGQRGTRRQAFQLGAVVTFTHTASVLLLGAVLTLGTLASPERVVPATEVLSGVLLAAVGVYLLVLAVRRRPALGHDHPHDHDHPYDHDHPHDHVASHDHVEPHDHGEPHDHDHDDPHVHDERPVLQPVGAEGGAVAVAPAPVAHSHGGRAHTHELPQGPLSWRTLAGMGVAGGLVPSPSALVVLLGATYLGRAWFGVVLVVLYGLGMAGTLTVAGLLLLRAQAALDRRGWAFGRDGRLGRLLPVLTAVVVVGVGLVLVLRGVLTAASLG
jgi:ABC-type nickel/cobalt efflux system permease component RcnA